MIAYFEKTRRAHYSTFALVICVAPCNGFEYVSAPRIEVASKAAARVYCKANDIKPWNF